MSSQIYATNFSRKYFHDFINRILIYQIFLDRRSRSTTNLTMTYELDEFACTRIIRFHIRRDYSRFQAKRFINREHCYSNVLFFSRFWKRTQERFAMSEVLIKRRWNLRSESLHASFLNSHAPVKREQELHESWWWVDWIYRSNERKHSSISSHQYLNQIIKLLGVQWCRWDCSSGLSIYQLSSLIDSWYSHWRRI